MNGTSAVETRRLAGTLITDDGAEIVAYAHGAPDAEATVVLSHGWAMSAREWRPHIDALTRPRPGFPALRAVTYDQRGHGRSTRGHAVLDMEVLGRDLALVLAQATTPDDGPVVLIGHSMGGMAVQQLAKVQPALFGTWVAGVGLFSTCLDAVGPVPVVAVDRPARRRPHTGQRFTDGLRRALFGPEPGTEAFRGDARSLRDIPPLTVAEFYAALTTHDCAGRLDALGRVPTRVLVGDLDCCTPPAQAVRLADDIPGAVLQTVPGQGHHLPYERPVLVVETVHALLREIRELGEPSPGPLGDLALPMAAAQ